MFAEFGDAGADAQDVQESGVGINLAPAVIDVLFGAREFGLGLVAGARDDALDVLGCEVGLGLQPEGDDTGGDRCCHRCAADGPHSIVLIEDVSLHGDQAVQFLLRLLFTAILSVESAQRGDDVVSGSDDVGLHPTVQGRAAGTEGNQMAFLAAHLFVAGRLAMVIGER